MTRSAWLAAVLLAAACSRPSSPNAPAEYSPADGAYTTALPGGWKVDDGADSAAFFGTGGEMIRISRHAGRTPEEYRASLGGAPTPLAETSVAGAKAWELRASSEFRDPHAGTQKLSSRVVLVPYAGGVWALEHVWPASSAESKAVFDGVLSTFKLKNP